MDELEQARKEYNKRFPSRPIRRIGDTTAPFMYLVTLAEMWREGRELTTSEIEEIEFVAPRGAFT